MKTNPPFDGVIHAVSAKTMPDLSSPKREPGWFLGEPTPTRDEAVLPSEITEAQINSACLSYRHDFGLLNDHDKERLRFVAKEWLHAWRKEFDPLAPALASAPAPASGRVDAVLNLYREAVRVDVKMEGPQFMGANSSALKRAWEADRASLSPAATSVSEAGGEAARSWRRTKFEFIGAMRQALINSGLTREQVIIADNAITEAFSALAKPASSPAGVREAIELLSHLKLYVLEKLDADDADALQDRMHDLTAALSQSTSAGRVGE